jgi:hypothetical protein
MTVPSGTFQEHQSIGTREDLADIIYDISPTDTPVMSNIARDSCSQVFCEWQTDELEAATAGNAKIEGDDANINTASPTTRYGNYCQISTKAPSVSGTLRAENTAGRRDELSYQVMKRGRELKRDIESAICGLQAATAGAAASARALAGMASWLWDNQVKAGGAADTTGTTPAIASGAPGTAPTAGTAAAFAEAALASALALCWEDGGDPSMIVMKSADKRLASQFSGIATQYRDNAGSVGPAVVVGAADIYVSDWGTVYFVASRFMPAGNVYCIDPEYWCVSYLRPIQQEVLAKTGDSDKRLLLAEYTLKAKEPKSSGKVYTTTST